MMVNRIFTGDALTCLSEMDAQSVDCIITSPPYYGLRDYGIAGQIGQEKTPEEYIDRLVAVFREARRVLKDTGTLWVNIGDSYNGSGKGGANYPENAKKYKQGTNRGSVEKQIAPTHVSNCKPKDLIGIPWMLAFALRADGWYLRQDIIWHKPNCMPESVKDRCVKSHEYLFLLSKQRKYYFNHKAIQEPAVNGDPNSPRGSKGTLTPNAGRRSTVFGGKKYGNVNEMRLYSGNEFVPMEKRNKRDVWDISTGRFKGAHFAVFPEKLIEPCVLAGCPTGGVVLDPFLGSGTTAAVASRLGRSFLGIEINPDYTRIAESRLSAMSNQCNLLEENEDGRNQG